MDEVANTVPDASHEVLRSFQANYFAEHAGALISSAVNAAMNAEGSKFDLKAMRTCVAELLDVICKHYPCLEQNSVWKENIDPHRTKPPFSRN